MNCTVERDSSGEGDDEGGSTSVGSSGDIEVDEMSTSEGSSETGEMSTSEAVAEEELDACGSMWAQQYCKPDDGQPGKGIQFCGMIDDEMRWGPCVHAIECWPGDVKDCDPWNGAPYAEECRLDEAGEPVWVEFGDECWTPLVLRFDAAPVELVRADGHGFDISGMGACFNSDWPTAATPWLALDRDGNGWIDDARELFGSGVVLKSGRGARDGFAALAEFDDDADGRITERDAVWSSLLLWSDYDADRRSSAWELEPLADRGVTQIDLMMTVDRRCDARGNCEAERSSFHYFGGSVGEVIDLHLACQ